MYICYGFSSTLYRYRHFFFGGIIHWLSLFSSLNKMASLLLNYELFRWRSRLRPLHALSIAVEVYLCKEVLYRVESMLSQAVCYWTETLSIKCDSNKMPIFYFCMTSTTAIKRILIFAYLWQKRNCNASKHKNMIKIICCFCGALQHFFL